MSHKETINGLLINNFNTPFSQSSNRNLLYGYVLVISASRMIHAQVDAFKCKDMIRCNRRCDSKDSFGLHLFFFILHSRFNNRNDAKRNRCRKAARKQYLRTLTTQICATINLIMVAPSLVARTKESKKQRQYSYLICSL